MDIEHMTAAQISEGIRSRSFTAPEVTQAALAVIGEKNAKINAFLSVDAERAVKRAEQIQRKIESGQQTGSLAGVPVAIKDNLCIAGMPATCGSKMLENYIPTYTAEAVLRLERAGAVVLGKTNMDEFAMGSTTENSAFGITRNPLAFEHVPGGSSGGSCAAVAAGMVPAALGTDTGGSVRLPAAWCGLVGLKPTYGRISRYGLIAYGSSLEQVGPAAKTVDDCARIFSAIAGRDDKDSTSAEPMTPEKDRGRGKLKIGIPVDYFGRGEDPIVREKTGQAAEALRAAGACVEEFTLGMIRFVLPAYYVIACAEAGSNLGRYDGVKYGYRTETYENLHEMIRRSRTEGFGREVKRRIMVGAFVLSTGNYEDHYLKALKVRGMIRESFRRAFARYDAILTPTAPTAAPKIGENGEDPLKAMQSDLYTVPANLAGIPALSVPCGIDQRGLPLGIQLMGDYFQEELLFGIARIIEVC